MKLSICLEITTFRYLFVCLFTFFYFALPFSSCFHCFGQEYWVAYGVLYHFREGKIP